MRTGSLHQKMLQIPAAARSDNRGYSFLLSASQFCLLPLILTPGLWSLLLPFDAMWIPSYALPLIESSTEFSYAQRETLYLHPSFGSGLISVLGCTYFRSFSKASMKSSLIIKTQKILLLISVFILSLRASSIILELT